MVKSTNSSKVAVIGCGHWGKNLARNFSELGALAAVHDIKPDTANAIARQYKVPQLSFEEILANENITGIIIATPSEQHTHLANQGLMAGKHVFVEKPLTLNYKEAKNLTEIAQSQNRILMVGHLLQYHPAFVHLKDMVHSGAIGKISSIYSNRLNLTKIRSTENCMWDLAPHDLSMILALTKVPPTLTSADGMTNVNDNIIDTATISLTFPDAIKAKIFVSWVFPTKEQKLIVIGHQGMIIFDDTQPWEAKLTHHSCQTKWVDNEPQVIISASKTIPIQPAEPLKLECQHFLNCLAANQQPSTNGPESLAVIKILEAAQADLNNIN